MASNCFVSSLPSDLLDLILYRLPIADYIRSGAVCRSWRQATAGKPHPRNPNKSPLLMFPGADEGSDDPDSFTFFSISDGTLHRFRLPQIRGKQIAGSSHGSIVAIDPTEILLLDPLTGAEVRLPPVAVSNRYTGDLEYPCIKKLTFSPSTSTAVAFYKDLNCDTQYLSFARVGDLSWTVIRKKKVYNRYYRFRDVIIHRGEFYVLDHNGSLLSFDPAAGTTVTIHCYRGGPFPIGYDQMYLAESIDGDHLLLVCSVMNWGLTQSLYIFRQDKVGVRWLSVEPDTLGEVVIFVGRNYSTCIFTRGMPDLRSWSRDDFGVLRSMGQNKDDFKVPYLDNRSIQKHVALTHFRLGRPSSLWILPISP